MIRIKRRTICLLVMVWLVVYLLSTYTRQDTRVVTKPYTPTTVFYVPHPDDESLFMAGNMLSTEGRVVVVLLTQGAASGAFDRVNAKLEIPLTVEEFKDARVQEFLAAIKHLGADEVIILDNPDRGLKDLQGQVVSIITYMELKYPEATHVSMSPRDFHPDHNTMGYLLHMLQSTDRITNIQHVYVNSGFHYPGTYLTLTPDMVELKRRALLEYKVWNPGEGRYAVGYHSAASLIDEQYNNPTEKVHE